MVRSSFSGRGPAVISRAAWSCPLPGSRAGDWPGVRALSTRTSEELTQGLDAGDAAPPIQLTMVLRTEG